MVEPDFGRVHIELRRKGVTLMLLWQEYRAAHEGRRTWAYTQFCEHYKAFAKTLKRSMRQHRRAGEKLFIDYAGSTLALADGSRAQVFVAAMGASSYTFACATADQSMRSWLGAMARALSFYGGVPQLIVPDNPRSLVSDACRYEPKLNETVRDFARHYDVSILPARPFSPRDKASVAAFAVAAVHQDCLCVRPPRPTGPWRFAQNFPCRPALDDWFGAANLSSALSRPGHQLPLTLANPMTLRTAVEPAPWSFSSALARV